MKTTPRPSPLALAVLALLWEAPMHPYRMQLLIKQRGKDEVVNVRQRASLYQTIDRLLRAGLIAVHATARTEKRPERTIYALTDDGRRTTLDWLRQMLATPAREYPEFPAALAVLPLLPPEEALTWLEMRLRALEAESARIDKQLTYGATLVPRLFLIESEYMRATLDAELAWVRAIVDDLRAGRLTWSEAWMREVAAALEGPDPTMEESEP